MTSGDIGALLAGKAISTGNGPPADHTAQWVAQAYQYFQQGKLDAAAQEAGRVLQVKPNESRAIHLLGLVALSRGSLNEAYQLISRSIELVPNESGYHANLGEVFRTAGDVPRAEAAFLKAITLNPLAFEAHANLSILRLAMGRFADAEAGARRAIEIKPDFATAHNTLGTVLGRLGRLDEAKASFKKAAELQPNFHVAHSNYLLALNYDPAIPAAAVADAHRKWGQLVESTLTSGGHTPALKIRGRVRLGILSPDMRKHSVAYLLEPLLEAIDHNQFHITCYSDSRQTDEVSRRLRRLSDAWRDVATVDDTQLCKVIAQDEVDVLVDVAGHTANNRLPMFARYPAPRAVTLFGYPNTTGLRAITFRMSDSIADLPDADGMYVEKLLRMNRLCWVFKPSEEAPSVSELPALKNGYITFGSFNNVHKISRACADAWAKAIAAVPGSRLLLLAAAGEDNAYARTLISEAMAKAGVEPERLRIEGKRPRAEYLKLIGEADVALDPFPYNGGITTAETLWQGVPVLSVVGDRYASRQGLAVLSAVGLTQWCASSAEVLPQCAHAMVSDLSALDLLRKSLRERVATSPLVDAAGYAREFERVLLAALDG